MPNFFQPPEPYPVLVRLACPNCEQADMIDVNYFASDLTVFPASLNLARLSVWLGRPACGHTLDPEMMVFALGQAIDRLSDAIWDGQFDSYLYSTPSPAEPTE